MEQSITALAEKLGIAADRLWPQMVAVTYYTSLFWLVIQVATLVATPIVFVILGPKVKKAMDDLDSEFTGIGGALLLTGLMFASFLAILTIPGSIAGIVSPEAQTALRLLH